MLTRRTLMGTALGTAALLAAPVLANAKPRIVVIGGGPGGATCARYLARDGMFDVTLIEPQAAYVTCFFSNLYIGGIRTLESLTHSYDRLAAEGVTIVAERATGVDRAARMVATESASLPYDHLVVAPGIDFIEGSVPGWELEKHAEIMPHAYKAGKQTELLKAQVLAMPQGGTFCLIAPPNPYRCPPGPYERISMVAHALSALNPTAKILLIDPKEKFSKQGLFEEGWQNHYPGVVTRIGPELGAETIEVRPEAMEVVVDGEVNKVDVCNVIPAQKAGEIAALAGLTDDKGWCPVTPEDMRSKIDRAITVLGDASSQGDMPKSAFSANSQAKVAAMVIKAELTGGKPFPAKYANTCWSLIAPDDGVKLGASYEPADGKIASTHSFISDYAEPSELRKATWEESVGWYEGIVKDIWG